ncbi:SPNS1 [Bugula neritina]|uniref:SPNS1 n=1 Tax=Bugula neritina TaxID=10212 RepID=A0A7J7KKY3_BUGNE|nr:SPNS1 [Bugula neritina]
MSSGGGRDSPQQMQPISTANSKEMLTRSGSITVTTTTTGSNEGIMTYRTRYITVAILFFVNLLNYMDRYTIAGTLYTQSIIMYLI